MLVWLGFMGVGEDVLFFLLSFFSFLFFFSFVARVREGGRGVG